MEGYFLDFWAEAVSFFIGGLFLGSFINVVALSYDNVAKIIKGRSACPQCHHPLAWYELIPLVSFIIQFGKCRSCKKPISAAYFAVELGTGLLFALSYLALRPVLGFWMLLLVLLILLFWLVILLHDAYTMLVPLELVAVAAGVTGLFHLVAQSSSLVSVLGGAVIGGVTIALIRLVGSWLAKQEAMGTADIYVAAMVGLLVGVPYVYVALLAAFIIGSVYGVVIGVTRPGGLRKVEVPFAPALLLGGVVALLYGSSIISWYWGYL